MTRGFAGRPCFPGVGSCLAGCAFPDGCRFVRAGGRVKDLAGVSRRPEGVLEAGGCEPIIGLGGGKRAWRDW